MADQLRYDFIGREFTPNINRLLEDSTVFPKAYCASPLCVPARGAFFTGLYPNTNGSLINPWDPHDAKYGQVKSGTPNLYTMMEDDWDSWQTGKQHLYTEENFDTLPESKTRWLPRENGYGQYLKAAGKRSAGGDAFRGVTSEMAEGRITRLKK